MAPRYLSVSGAVVGGVVWQVPDPGIPLLHYSPPTDPLALWKSQPSLRKVVSYVARQVGQLSWHAYVRVSDTDRKRLRDSPAEQLIRRPGRFVSRFGLIEQLVVDKMLYDRYCAIATDEGELIRIPPKLWRVKSDWLGRASEILLRVPNGDNVDITEAPLVIGWGWGDVNAGGVSPMFTLAKILEEAKQAVDWRTRQWSKDPGFTGLLKHPSSFKSEKARETFTVSWKEWMNGRKGTPILEDGMDYVDPPTVDPEKIRDIEGRQLTDVEVASAYHVPPELVGARAGNFSNVQAFRSMLYGPILGPMIVDLQEAVNRIVPIVEPRERVYLEINREGAINGSLLEQARVLQTMSGGPIMTRAEARATMNLPYIAGTDELIVPMNVTEGGLASPTDAGDQNAGETRELEQ